MDFFESFINDSSDIELFGEEETLNEYTLYDSNKESYSVHIDPDSAHRESFLKDPYIKVYDSYSYSKARNCIRVHLFTGVCEHHNDSKGGLNFNNKDWKKFLNKVIDLPSTNPQFSNLTVYQAAIETIKLYLNTTPRENEYLDSQICFSDFTECTWGGKNVKQER